MTHGEDFGDIGGDFSSFEDVRVFSQFKAFCEVRIQRDS